MRTDRGKLARGASQSDDDPLVAPGLAVSDASFDSDFFGSDPEDEEDDEDDDPSLAFPPLPGFA